jgi:hypothetical protein
MIRKATNKSEVSREDRKDRKDLEIRDQTSDIRFSTFQSFQHLPFASSACFARTRPTSDL